MRCSPRTMLAALVVAGLAGPVLAQTAQRSTIEGTITDPQAASVHGATVTLSSARLLGGMRHVETDLSGRYRFAGLLPGSYELAVVAPGFQRFARGDIQVLVETTVTVNVPLLIAGLTEQVHVAAVGGLIDVRSAASPIVFAEPVLHDVPTDRTLQSLLSLAPGVVTTTPLYGYVGQVAYGGTQGSNGITVDGVNLTESSTGDQWTQVNYNWIEQAQVTGLGAPAEYGGTTGATVNGVLRSGSNRVSGLGEFLTIRPTWTGDNLASYPAGLAQPIPPKTILSWWDLNGQVGAPLVRDRLWLFAGANRLAHEYRTFGYAGPGSTRERTGRAIAKIDASLRRDLQLQAFVTRDASDLVGAQIWRDRPSPESSADTFTRRHAWNVRATWMLSPATVVELRTSGNTGAADNEPHAPATLDGPSPSSDRTTGIHCCNAFWGRDRRSAVFGTVTLAHSLDGAGGRHDLRSGLEFERAPVDNARGIPTGRELTTDNGTVVGLHVWAGDHTQSTARRTAFYAQDRWALGTRVTLEPGVRVEMNRGSVPGVAGAYATNPVAPRLGLAWDVRGTQSTLVRAHYGRYHDPLFGAVYEYTQPNAHSPHIFYEIVNGMPVEQFRYIEELALPRPSALKQSHVDQWVAGIAQAVNGTTTVAAQYIARRFENFIGWTDRRLGDWTPFTVTDPGPDGIPGTGDDGGPFAVYEVYGDGIDVSDRALELGNPAGAYRRYDAVQVIATRRFARNLQYQLSYTWSRAEGTVDNTYRTNATYSSMNPFGFGANPGVQAAGAGAPRYDYREFKALGSYRVPWLGGFMTGAVFRWHDGTRWQRMARVFTPIFAIFPVEPVGSRRTPSLGALDLRAEKTFRVSTTTIGLYADVFNLTNVGRATDLNPISGPNFQRVNGWTDPRTGRIGLRWGF